MNTPHSTKPASLFISDEEADKFADTLSRIYEEHLEGNANDKGRVIVTLPARLQIISKRDRYSPIIWKFEGSMNVATIRLWAKGAVPYHDDPNVFELFKLAA